MKSERLGLWLSLLANIGVLVGIGLLVIEIRHNTSATEAVLNQENVNFMRENAALLLSGENKELAQIVRRGNEDPDSLSRDEFAQYNLFTSMQMVAWETAFLNYDQGLIDERYWRGTDAGYSSMLQRFPGYRRCWEGVRGGYDERFRSHVESVLEAVN